MFGREYECNNHATVGVVRVRAYARAPWRVFCIPVGGYYHGYAYVVMGVEKA